MKESVPALSTSPAPPKSAPRSHEQVSAVPPPAPVAETQISTTDVSENGNMQEAEGESSVWCFAATRPHIIQDVF